MQQNRLRAGHFSIWQANLALFVLMFGYILIDLYEIIYVLASGNMPLADVSIWTRIAVDIPIMIIAFYCASPVRALRFVRPKARNISYTVLLTLFTYIAMSVLLNFLAETILTSGGTIPEDTLVEEMVSQPFALTFFFLCILAPFTEEILFRGMLQGAYERKYGFAAIVFSGVLFGLVHADPLSVVNGAVLGLLLGYLYLKTRSIWCPIVMHALYNLFAFTLIPDYFILNLPWVVGAFDMTTAHFGNAVYAAYNLLIGVGSAILAGVMIWVIRRENSENQPKQAGRMELEPPRAGQTTFFVMAAILIALRFILGISSYLM
ncbi:MAG: CPBP family intramembrane glutamic endopeptidase [Christensenellaceae bacterium]|jgi:membrane protease YdiL (CAAX protease family)